jgi:predicted dinucleotide-binding enzyme
MNAMLMVDPSLVPGDHSVFLSGNDAAAKDAVAVYLQQWFGWKKENIIDIGDMTTARGTEMLLPIWVRLYGAFKSPMFNFHIARAK